MGGASLGYAAALLATAALVFWVSRLRAVRIPRDRRPLFAALGLAVALGIAAFARGPGLAGGIAAGLAVAVGGVFLALQLQAGQDRREPAVRVGGPILDFSAPDAEGQPFQLASLTGHPFLLKFFRGHW